MAEQIRRSKHLHNYNNYSNYNHLSICDHKNTNTINYKINLTTLVNDYSILQVECRRSN